ncbi:MAG: pseudouridine synthase [Bacteroidota bacterium]
MSKRRSKRDNRQQRPNKRKKRDRNAPTAQQNYNQNEKIRINKFIAHAGYCSRRDADELVEQGRVEVNGEIVTEHGSKVTRQDEVRVNGELLSLEPFVYILLNKPKDTISTTDDEKNRHTVMDQIEDATGKRVYPVGRLDRDTMGLLLLTNDGDLAHRLMHPSFKVQKVYDVWTDRPLSDDELANFIDGIQLEDGMASAEMVKRAKDDSRLIRMVLLEGRNRQIRRMVEACGTTVDKLKRVMYAGLDLKNVKMGRWRYLKKNEVNQLRRMVKLQPLNFKK